MSMTSSLRLDIQIMFDHDRTSSGHYLRKCQKCFDILVFLFISNLRGLHGLPSNRSWSLWQDEIKLGVDIGSISDNWLSVGSDIL